MAAPLQVSPAELAESREKLRRELVQLSRISPLATIVTDAIGPDNAIIAANDAFEKLSGYTEAEVLGQDCRILSGKATSPASKAILRNAIIAGEPTFVTLLNYRKDGEPFYNAVMIAPVYDDSGMLAFFLGTQLEVDSERLLPDAKARLANLSPQQLRVLERMARGLRHADIASDLGLSVKTVKMHRGALVQRLGVATSTEAIRIAVEAGL
jgi:PAS domain S-box-containing protein